MSLEKLFNPKSIAIVGASSEEGKVGNVIAKNILELGYQGEVFLVNPKYDEIFGKKCYKSLSEIENEIDLAIIAIPAKFVIDVIKEGAKINTVKSLQSEDAKGVFNRVKNYVVISAGFSEIGEEGKKKEAELAKIAKENNLNILGPNCLGFIAPHIKLNASFAGGMPESGNISFVTQSGALAVALMDAAKKEGLKFSNIVSVGNKMEITETEMLKYLAEDENTKVIGMYLEGIKDGKAFLEASQKISKVKPVVILKAGKNEKTQRAISSHTGALAGDDDIVSVAFEKSGIIRASNLEEFFNILSLISFSDKIPNEKIAVITNAGGAGVLISDAFNGKGVELAEMSQEIKNKLKKKLPIESSVENPIDLLGDAMEDRYRNILEIISEISEIGSIICLLTPQKQTPVSKIADEIIEFNKKTKKLFLAVFLGGEKVEEGILKLKQNKISTFAFPDLAVSALDNFYKWSKFKNSKIKLETQIVNKKRREKVLKIIEKAKKEKRQALYFQESAEVMSLYGINTVESFNSISYKNKSLKYPVALKIDSDKILHKTDRNGLILGIKDKIELERAIEQMNVNFPKSRLIIQPMAEKGTELILGIKKDQTFGPIVVYGLGGIYTEFLRRIDYLVSPFSMIQAEKTLSEGKISFLFSGARGQKKYNLEEMARILLGISSLALEISEIREFDINPLVIYNNSKEALALDVKIIL